MARMNSGITQKLKHKFLVLYTGLFVVLAILTLSGSAFYIFHNTRSNVSTTISLISDSLVSYERNIQEKSYTMFSSDSLEQLLDFYYESPSSETQAKVNQYLGNCQSSDSSLLFILLEDSDGNVFYSINYSSSGIVEFLMDQDAYRVMKGKNTSRLSPVQDSSFFNTSAWCYYITSQFLRTDTFQLTFCFDAESLVKSLQTGTAGLNEMFIFNREKECFYTSDDTDKQPFPEYLENVGSSFNDFFSASGYHYVVVDYYYSYYIVGIIYYSRLAKNLILLSLVMLAVYFIPLFFVLMRIIPANNQLLEPLISLSKEVSAFSLGAPPAQIYYTGDEVETLSRSFRQMTLNINQQADELAEKEREKAVTYYKLLTTQLDPHFVYNTMNIINILARKHADEDIILVNTALTRILRERLNTQNITYETVENEIEALKQYQIIMDYRYNHQVELEYEVDPTVALFKIPKNILQPLVENAYYHGLVKSDGSISGIIGIVVYQMENHLVIEVSDDGNGFSEKALQTTLENLRTNSEHPGEATHIGIENIYRRIHYLYGNDFSMDIQSEPGYGATISITLPLRVPEPLHE